jgi:hypothetical protein
LAGTSARKENDMERTYESAAALVDRATGALAPDLGLFVTLLISQQYAARFSTGSHPSAESSGDIGPMTSFSPSSRTYETTDYVPPAHPAF